MSCSDHHLSDAVDRAETSSVDLEQTVYTRRQFYFSLGDLRWYKKCRIIHPAGDDIARVVGLRPAGGHTNTAAQLVEYLRRVVFVHHGLICLPDIDIFFANG